MTAVTMVAIERTGPAIRAALAVHAPEDEARFVAELREALVRAEQDLDLAGSQAVLRRWHARALTGGPPLPEPLGGPLVCGVRGARSRVWTGPIL